MSDPASEPRPESPQNVVACALPSAILLLVHTHRDSSAPEWIRIGQSTS